jgi:hypothetical protein
MGKSIHCLSFITGSYTLIVEKNYLIRMDKKIVVSSVQTHGWQGFQDTHRET